MIGEDIHPLNKSELVAREQIFFLVFTDLLEAFLKVWYWLGYEMKIHSLHYQAYLKYGSGKLNSHQVWFEERGAYLTEVWAFSKYPYFDICGGLKSAAT